MSNVKGNLPAIFQFNNSNFEEFEERLKDLLYGEFHWWELTKFLKEVIDIAEEFYPESGSGQAKLDFAMSIWDYFDEKYELVDKLDALVDFKKFFGTAVGGVLEVFDDRAIRALIEQILIPVLVSALYDKPGR